MEHLETCWQHSTGGRKGHVGLRSIMATGAALFRAASASWSCRRSASNMKTQQCCVPTSSGHVCDASRLFRAVTCIDFRVIANLVDLICVFVIHVHVLFSLAVQTRDTVRWKCASPSKYDRTLRCTGRKSNSETEMHTVFLDGLSL